MDEQPHPYVIELVDQVLAEFGYDWQIFRRPRGGNVCSSPESARARERVWAACRDRATRCGATPSYPELALACLGRRQSHATVIESVARYRKRAS
jgi:hypothetical protein